MTEKQHAPARIEALEALLDRGLTGQYLIIRPVSPADPPGPEDMARITGAINTLIELGMIAGSGGDWPGNPSPEGERR